MLGTLQLQVRAQALLLLMLGGVQAVLCAPCMLQGFQAALTCCLRAALPAGAMLFDARQLFDQREAKADAALRAIATRLPEAVATCLDAAAADLDAPRQAALLKVCPCPVLCCC